ncbi:copper resistance CopC family protein [Azospirillum sp. sgz301742]
MIRRTLLTAALLLALPFALAAGPASAHAVVQEAHPADGAVVPPDTDVRLRFNSRIDHARSRLTLSSGKANAVAVPPAADVPPDTLAARLNGLAPGPYRLQWQVLSVDGHITRGEIRFSVGAP